MPFSRDFPSFTDPKVPSPKSLNKMYLLLIYAEVVKIPVLPLISSWEFYLEGGSNAEIGVVFFT